MLALHAMHVRVGLRLVARGLAVAATSPTQQWTCILVIGGHRVWLLGMRP